MRKTLSLIIIVFMMTFVFGCEFKLSSNTSSNTVEQIKEIELGELYQAKLIAEKEYYSSWFDKEFYFKDNYLFNEGSYINRILLNKSSIKSELLCFNSSTVDYEITQEDFDNINSFYYYPQVNLIVFNFNEQLYAAYVERSVQMRFEPIYYDESSYEIQKLYELHEETTHVAYVTKGSEFIQSFEFMIKDEEQIALIFSSDKIVDDRITLKVTKETLYCVAEANGEEIIILAEKDNYGRAYISLPLVDGIVYAIYEAPEIINEYHLTYDYNFRVDDDLTNDEKKEIAVDFYTKWHDSTHNPHLNITYYGRYSGGVAIYVTANYLGYTQALWSEEVGKYTINYKDGNRIWYLFDHEFYTLNKAYSTGLITDDDAAKIWMADTGISISEPIVVPPLVCYKPIIYLYPTKALDLTLKFEDPSRLITTYPKYNDGWQMHVDVDSTITIDNRSYYALFFDEKANYLSSFTEGFYVEKEDAYKFLEAALDQMGFNYKEANEFMMFWLPILEQNEKSLVYFEQTEERNNECPLIITEDVDTYLRVIIHIKQVDSFVDIKPQELEHVERSGFTLVEWGGVIY